jgi:hypothetical protein
VSTVKSCDRTPVPGLSVRGSPDWVRWVKKAAAREARSCSSLVEMLLIKWARSEGLPDPPPRQTSAETARFL